MGFVEGKGDVGIVVQAKHLRCVIDGQTANILHVHLTDAQNMSKKVPSSHPYIVYLYSVQCSGIYALLVTFHALKGVSSAFVYTYFVCRLCRELVVDA